MDENSCGAVAKDSAKTALRAVFSSAARVIHPRPPIKRIQAAGVMDISEVERICRALQDVVQELRILIDQ